jgi:Ca2+-transporting ATPase
MGYKEAKSIIAMWASEPVPLIQWKNFARKYKNHNQRYRRQFFMVHEYPLDGKPPMMTHVFENKKVNVLLKAACAEVAK